MNKSTYAEACICDLQRAPFHTYCAICPTQHCYDIQQAISADDGAEPREFDRTEVGCGRPGNDQRGLPTKVYTQTILHLGDEFIATKSTEKCGFVVLQRLGKILENIII